MIQERFYIALTTALISITMSQPLAAQTEWSMDQCMDYAVKHAHRVMRSRIEAENAQIGLQQARGAFIPSVNAGVGTQVSWGRNVDPETNTYNNVATLNNSYSLNAGLTLWDGLQSVNALKQARLNVHQSRTTLQEVQDHVAMDVMQLFIDAIYAEESMKLAHQKQQDSHRMLEKTRLLAEMGEKGLPDVAQMEAQVSADDYEVVRIKNTAEKAMHALLLAMNLQQQETIKLVVTEQDTSGQLCLESASLYRIPTLISAENRLKMINYDLKMTRGRLSPTLSVGAGINTGYFRNLTGDVSVPGFKEQWKNNRGEYVSASLSIPIFQFGSYKQVRRAKKMVALAALELDETQKQVQEAYRQALRQARGTRQELQLMKAKIGSDSIAHRLNCRRYEEGLLSALDLQTSAQALHQSRIRLLQTALNLAMQLRVARYYETGVIYHSGQSKQ